MPPVGLSVILQSEVYGPTTLTKNLLSLLKNLHDLVQRMGTLRTILVLHYSLRSTYIIP